MSEDNELREDMAPRIAAKLLARQKPIGWTLQEAIVLAHELIAMVQAAQLLATSDMAPKEGDQ